MSVFVLRSAGWGGPSFDKLRMNVILYSSRCLCCGRLGGGAILRQAQDEGDLIFKSLFVLRSAGWGAILRQAQDECDLIFRMKVILYSG